MAYPYRYPFSKFLARHGVTINIQIDVFKDAEAGVLVATSKDIDGLVIEAETFAELRDGVAEAIPALISLKDDCSNNHNNNHTSADVLYREHMSLV
jgi:hypothetical protein